MFLSWYINKFPKLHSVCPQKFVCMIYNGTYKSLISSTEALHIAKLQGMTISCEVLVRQSSASNFPDIFIIREMSHVNEPNHIFKARAGRKLNLITHNVPGNKISFILHFNIATGSFYTTHLAYSVLRKNISISQ